MGVFSISSHHGVHDQPTQSPTTKIFNNSPINPSPPSSALQQFQKATRKISVPLSFYSSHHHSDDARNLEEAEVASDRKNLFSSVKFPSLSSSKFHHHHGHHTVSPIKVQVSPAEPTRSNISSSIPSTVRITRRHTEHAGTIRKFTPPMQMPPITFLQPPAVPSVSNFPEPIVLSRPTPIPEESMEEIIEAGSPAAGAGIPSLPATSYRFKLPPLQVTHSTLMSTNRVPDFDLNENALNNKPMPSVSEPMRNKAASFALESPNRVSKYRVFFKCFFVVLFLSIPVVIFVVMMALSGGFSPFQASTNNNNKTLNSNASMSQMYSATTTPSNLKATTTNDLWLSSNS